MQSRSRCRTRRSTQRGSYEQQDGRTYTYYDARWNETDTDALEENEILVPAGVFQSILYSGFGLETRTDGEIVVVEAFVCDGADCDGYSKGSHHTTQGRKFEAREGIVFTDDEFRIPIEAYDIKVQYLHTNPPTPTPTPHPACPDDNPGCPVFHTWPPFTLTYETDGDSIWEDGVNKAGREVKRLVWNSNRDWRIDTLSADDIVLSFMTMNTTGSYEIFKDGTYTAYDASDGSLRGR